MLRVMEIGLGGGRTFGVELGCVCLMDGEEFVLRCLNYVRVCSWRGDALYRHTHSDEVFASSEGDGDG